MLLQAPVKNGFLAMLTAAESEKIAPHLTPLTMQPGDFIYRTGNHVVDLAFPHSGLIAVRMRCGDSPGAGLAFVGRDGIVAGFLAEAAIPAICDAEVLIGGQASAMPASAFRHLLRERPAIRALAVRCHAQLLAQYQQAGHCASRHSVDARVSRCLLEIADRTAIDDIPLLQGQLAQLLGVQRTTVNLVLGQLERAGAVKSGRGHIRIIDRAALARHCCECYGRLKAYYAKLFAGEDVGLVPEARAASVLA